jgi:hypothetical protein
MKAQEPKATPMLEAQNKIYISYALHRELHAIQNIHGFVLATD